MSILRDRAGNTRVWPVLVFAGMVFAFFMTALGMGKDSLIFDLLLIITGALGGGGVGYVFGYIRGREEPSGKS